MRTFDFAMNLDGTEVAAGGVGMIAVDLLHKKERNAYHLMQHFFKINQENGSNVAMLHPFKTSFYKKMGFGIGTRVYQFHLDPTAFKNFQEKDHLNELSITDKGKVMACYNRIYEQTHGMTKRSETGRELNRPFQFGRVVGYVVDGKVRGYMVFSVEEKALHIHELFFETPEVMNEFSTFLNSQADQIDKIIFNANNDDILHFVHSPESEESPMTDFDSNVENKHIAHVGAGVMYRIINCQGFFEELKEKEHTFGRETVNLKLVIADEFYPENHSSVILQINEGRLEEIRQDGHFDVELRMDIGGFSSLVMGAVNVTSLHKWGLAELSDKAYLRIINSLFTTDSRPAVTKAF